VPLLAAAAFAAVLAALAVFQVALVAGAPLGRLAWGGQDRVLPKEKRTGSVVSVVLYALFALLGLERVGAIDLLPAGADTFVRIAMWVVAAYLALGILMNLASRSKPERYVMTPVVTVLAALGVVLAIG
jgi:hypothetical protein